MSPIWSLNTTGVVIVLSPLWFPHGMAGFKQAQETEEKQRETEGQGMLKEINFRDL